MAHETFISVDVEASGPIPGDFSLLSIGACLVGSTAEHFYVELKPITRNYDPGALAVAGLDLDALERDGVEPVQAMTAFETWTAQVTAARDARSPSPLMSGGRESPDDIVEAAERAAGVELDHVIRAVVSGTAGGATVADLVMELIALRDIVLDRLLSQGTRGSASPPTWNELLGASRRRCSEMASEYFRERLFGLPRIVELVEGLRG